MVVAEDLNARNYSSRVLRRKRTAVLSREEVCSRGSRVKVPSDKRISRCHVSRTIRKESNIRFTEPTVLLENDEEPGGSRCMELGRKPEVTDKQTRQFRTAITPSRSRETIGRYIIGFCNRISGVRSV
jgi:hypothetical protein